MNSMLKEDIIYYFNLDNEEMDQIIIDRIIKLSNELKINLTYLRDIDFNDLKVYQFIQTKNTSNIYYLQNELMQEWIKEFQPNSFIELQNLLVLFRPSPLALGVKEKYLINKNNPKDIVFIKNFEIILKPILKDTFGLILYQEQVEYILKKVCNISLSNAINWRKLLEKRTNKENSKVKYNLIHIIRNNNYKKEDIEIFYEMISFFAPISYSRKSIVSHSKLVFYNAFLEFYKSQKDFKPI